MAFVSHTCLKAGLPADAWRDPETELLVFEAQVFGSGAE
jgi:AMMECR1 domain-containing protein